MPKKPAHVVRTKLIDGEWWRFVLGSDGRIWASKYHKELSKWQNRRALSWPQIQKLELNLEKESSA